MLCKALPSFNLLAKNIITYEVFIILFLEMVLIQCLPWKWKASTELQFTDFDSSFLYEEYEKKTYNFSLLIILSILYYAIIIF